MILEKLRELTWPSTWYGWRVGLQSWWYTRSKPKLAMVGVLICLPVIAGSLVHQVRVSQQNERQLNCLILNIYHEARGEPLAGQYAVAEVTLNRVASPRFPDTICDVVYEQRWDRIRKRNVGAFSWTELTRSSDIDRQAAQNAREIAEAVYGQQFEPRVEEALFYHASYIRPSWARTKDRVASIGRHIFYK